VVGGHGEAMARAPAALGRGDRLDHQAGLDQGAQVPAHGVGVHLDHAGELGDVGRTAQVHEPPEDGEPGGVAQRVRLTSSEVGHGTFGPSVIVHATHNKHIVECVKGVGHGTAQFRAPNTNPNRS
jgi:hypothetical protein